MCAHNFLFLLIFAYFCLFSFIIRDRCDGVCVIRSFALCDSHTSNIMAKWVESLLFRGFYSLHILESFDFNIALLVIIVWGRCSALFLSKIFDFIVFFLKRANFHFCCTTNYLFVSFSFSFCASFSFFLSFFSSQFLGIALPFSDTKLYN